MVVIQLQLKKGHRIRGNRMHVFVLQLGFFKAASLSSVFSLPVSWLFGSLKSGQVYFTVIYNTWIFKKQNQNIVTASLATANPMTPNMVPVNLRANPLNVHVFDAQYVSNWSKMEAHK